eukprot:XP_001697089.1 predicted protein [Chlamydomonas reinhardtii]
MSEHPDDARTPGPKSRGGATGTSAISAIPEERRSGSRHKSLRRQISAALLVLHRAATGAVGSSAKGTPAGGKESGGGGLFALASEAALLPYSKRIPRSLSRGGANSSSMGELSNAIALGVADSIAASPRVAVADGGREAPVRAASATAAMLMRTAPPRTPTVNDAGHTVLPSRLAVVDVESQATRLPCLPGDRTSAAAGSDAAAESADVAGLASGPFEASAAGLVATLAVLQEATVEEDVEDELPLRLLEFVLSPPSQQAELLRRTHAGSRGSSGSGSIVLQLPSVRGGVVADLMAAVNTTRRTPHGGSDSEVDDAEEYDIFGLSHLLPPSRRTSPAGRIAAELAGQDAISLPLLQRAPQVPGNSSRSQELNLVSGCAIPPATAQHQSRPFPMQLSPSDLPLQQPLSADKLTDDFELLDPDADTALEDRLSPVGICARFTPGASPFRPAYASSRRLSLAPRCPNTVVGLADSLISTADGHGTSTVHSASFGHGGGSHGGTGAAAGGGSMASRMLGTLKKMSSLVRTPTATPQQTAAPPRRSATGLSNGRGSIGGVLPPAFSHLASLHALAPGSVRDAYGGQGRGRGGDGRDGAASNAFTLLSQTHSQRSSGGSGAGSGCGSGQPTASPGASAGSPAASVPASRRTLDMHDDLLEAARWSAAQRQERDMKRHVTQRAQAASTAACGTLPRRRARALARLSDAADVFEDGVRRGGPAWEIIQASRARQDQMVNQVSAWLREALAKKAAAAQATVAAQAAQ